MGMDPITLGLAASAGIGGASNLLAGETAKRSAEDTAKRQEAMNAAQIAENKRQFDILTPERAKQMGLQEQGLGLQAEGLGLQKSKQEALKKAYEESIGRGSEQMAGAEKQFMAESGTASPEIAKLKEDMLAGKSEAIGRAGREMGAQLELGGVRGGQAATQLRRGIESMGIEGQRDLNQLSAQEAMQREAERRAYLSAKSGRAQAGALGGVAL